MKHDLYEHDADLTHCKVCGGAEASLPTECPGVRMTEAQEQGVLHGELDCRAAWIDGVRTVRWWAPVPDGEMPKVALWLGVVENAAGWMKDKPHGGYEKGIALTEAQVQFVTALFRKQRKSTVPVAGSLL